MSDKTRAGDRLLIGGSPRADLLPPELKFEATLRAQRRALIGVAIVAVAVVAGIYAYLVIGAATSGIRLEVARAETNNLLTQQQEYAEVRILNDGVDTILNAQLLGASTEIDWTDYLDQVAATLPTGTSFQAISATTSAPGSAESIPEGPLQAPAIAQISFAATTPTLPDVSSWIDNLSTLPGYASAAVTAISLNTDGTYSVTALLNVNYGALENRFGNPNAEDGQ